MFQDFLPFNLTVKLKWTEDYNQQYTENGGSLNYAKVSLEKQKKVKKEKRRRRRRRLLCLFFNNLFLLYFSVSVVLLE